jgi:uncharacterized membrane protein
MTSQGMNSVRTVLLVLAVLLLGLTAYLYFQSGKLNFASFVVALGCLLIFLITRRKPPA